MQALVVITSQRNGDKILQNCFNTIDIKLLCSFREAKCREGLRKIVSVEMHAEVPLVFLFIPLKTTAENIQVPPVLLTCRKYAMNSLLFHTQDKLSLLC